MATKSIPTVFVIPVSMATLSLVPTPSDAETRIGSIKPAFFRSKTPPKLPTFPATPGMFCFFNFWFN